MGFFDFLSPDSALQKQLQEKDNMIQVLTDKLNEKKTIITTLGNEKYELEKRLCEISASHSQADEESENNPLVQSLLAKLNERKSIIMRINSEKSELESKLNSVIAKLDFYKSQIDEQNAQSEDAYWDSLFSPYYTECLDVGIETFPSQPREETVEDMQQKISELEFENNCYIQEIGELRNYCSPVLSMVEKEKEIQTRIDFLVKCSLQMKFYHILHCFCLQKILESKKAFCRQQYDAAVQKCNRQIHEYEENTSLEEYKQLRGFVSEWEFYNMSQPARNQLALDRYNKRRKNEFDIGLEYERYIGYLYEMQNYEVRYHGAINKFRDKGIDLYAISKKKKEVIVIQCKRWGKSSVVRENVILELSGSAKFAQTKFPKKQIKPILYTSTSVSKDALVVAGKVGVEVFENFDIQEYPLIKCNISETGEKIYHLPNFQRYDTIFITPSKGDFYAATVEEATSFGFRPAHRWKAEKKS